MEYKSCLKFIASESNQTYTALTEKGMLYCKKSDDLKQKIENEISEIIGYENVKIIKNLLKEEWKK